MTTTNPAPAVRRPLTDQEIDAVVAGINAATNSAELVVAAIREIFNALLADTGQRFDDFDEDNRINPADYAIPTSQWTALAAAMTGRAGEWGTGSEVALILLGMMPATYDDPDVPTPAIAIPDRRPFIHDLHLTRDAVDVITACERRLSDLGRGYGWESEIYLTASHTWHRCLAGLFSMGFGADTHVAADGPMSLFVKSASGFVYGIIFHADRRHCTVDGCGATIHDDGTTNTGRGNPPAHQHQPSYPLDAAQPGQWSVHS